VLNKSLRGKCGFLRADFNCLYVDQMDIVDKKLIDL